VKAQSTLVSLTALSVALLVGCATVDPSHTQYPRSEPHYFTGRFMMSLDPAYLDRYTCPDGRPLICVCTSMRVGTCDCSC
jgi:hypothetical protein